jgi:hypothetical protein
MIIVSVMYCIIVLGFYSFMDTYTHTREYTYTCTQTHIHSHSHIIIIVISSVFNTILSVYKDDI